MDVSRKEVLSPSAAQYEEFNQWVIRVDHVGMTVGHKAVARATGGRKARQMGPGIYRL